jgi:hypothetical protein
MEKRSRYVYSCETSSEIRNLTKFSFSDFIWKLYSSLKISYAPDITVFSWFFESVGTSFTRKAELIPNEENALNSTFQLLAILSPFCSLARKACPSYSCLAHLGSIPLTSTFTSSLTLQPLSISVLHYPINHRSMETDHTGVKTC